MQIYRGATPTIKINVRSTIDLSDVTALWAYIYQEGSIKVNKELSDVTIDTTNNRITLTLTQQDTLGLKADMGALFQIRLLLDGVALVSPATNIVVRETYKGGVISAGTT